MSKNLQLRTAWQKAQQQQQLRDTYGVADPNTVVVERKNVLTNTLRVLLQALGKFVQVSASIAIAALALIGLVALAYPGPRELLFDILLQTFQQFFSVA